MIHDYENDNKDAENENGEQVEKPETPETPEVPETPETPKIPEPEKTPVPEKEERRNEQHTSYTPQPTEEPKKKKEVRMSGGALATLLIVCMVVAILLGSGINMLIAGRDTESSGEGTVTPSETTTESTTVPKETAPAVTPGTVVPNPDDFVYPTTKVAEQCLPSVVIIRVTENQIVMGQEVVASASGSGVIYDSNGYILTNYHVVGEDTKTISVEMYDGQTYDAKFIYGDKNMDISVIKIEKTDCPAVKIADFSTVRVGEPVLVIGNPLGHGLAVTDGIVSALEKTVTLNDITMKLMQTNAAINSGNSGGGLFNMKGELIGLVNSKSGGTTVEGTGYAIPSSTIVKVLNDLRDYGYVRGQAKLGVTVSTRQYQTMDWPFTQVHTYVQVTKVQEGGSADKSGLKVGDILYKMNDQPIESYEELNRQLTRYKVGDTVTLTVQRPTVELTDNNLMEYLNTAKEVELQFTFVEFKPEA